MENIYHLIEILLDSGIMFFCCEGIFREKNARKLKDIIMLPIIIIFFMAVRLQVLADDQISFTFNSQGYEIAPVDNFWMLLFIVLAILLANSLYYKLVDNIWTFCGTMTAFSIYLATRTLGIAIFSLCGAAETMLSIGSRFLSILLVLFMYCTSAFEWLQQTITNGSFIIGLVSSNIAVILAIVLSFLSFDVVLFIDNLWIIFAILLFVLFLDIVLLYYNQHRLQEQKHIHMMEQYVPIVEELISQVRARQHEFHNQLFAIDAAVQSASTLEEAKRSVSALTTGMVFAPSDYDLLTCDSKIIAGMLYGKIKQAELSNVKVKLELNALFKKSITPETEWIEVIGILLDNALEAVSNGDTVYVKVRQIEKYLELTVSNPAAPMSNSEFVRLFHKGVTSKKDTSSHGFGLYNILRITERLHGKIVTRNEQIGQENYVVFGVLLP